MASDCMRNDRKGQFCYNQDPNVPFVFLFTKNPFVGFAAKSGANRATCERFTTELFPCREAQNEFC